MSEFQKWFWPKFSVHLHSCGIRKDPVLSNTHKITTLSASSLPTANSFWGCCRTGLPQVWSWHFTALLQNKVRSRQPGIRGHQQLGSNLLFQTLLLLCPLWTSASPELASLTLTSVWVLPLTQDVSTCRTLTFQLRCHVFREVLPHPCQKSSLLPFNFYSP